MRTDIRAEQCEAPGCERMGEALVERYAPSNPVSRIGINEPTGEWIWLCDRHVVEEFS